MDYCLKEQGTICWVATKSPKCWAHSASDAAPILCALDATVKLASASGEREIPLADMYVDDGIDYLSKEPDEILTEIIVPGSSDSKHCRSAFWKLRRRGSIDFSTLSVAASVWMDRDERATRASMYLGAVGSSPVPVPEISSELVGGELNEKAIAAVARAAHKAAQPMDNTDFAPSWRGKMAEQYAAAVLRELAGLPPERKPPRHLLRIV